MSREDYPRRVLVGVTAGAAVLQMPSIIMWLRSVAAVAQIKVVMTRRAAGIVSPGAFSMASGESALVDWSDDPQPGGVTHVTLGMWADLYLIAPATANLIAKAACGIADDLLTTCILSASCPVVIAPAMNVAMWKNRATQRNIKRLHWNGYHVVQPEDGYELLSSTQTFGSLPPVDRLWAGTLMQAGFRCNGADAGQGLAKG